MFAETPENGDRKPAEKDELKDLKSLAQKIFYTLGLIIVASGLMLALRPELAMPLIWACILAGILGSASSALISALQRKANGWETEDPENYLPSGGKEMFSQRMASFFLFRPALGIIAGLLIYFGMEAKYFGDTGLEEQANKPTAVVFKLYKELKALQFELIVTEVKEKH